jgi:hypothetical protein
MQRLPKCLRYHQPSGAINLRDGLHNAILP